MVSVTHDEHPPLQGDICTAGSGGTSSAGSTLALLLARSILPSAETPADEVLTTPSSARASTGT
ncbi:hypothetical protein [Nocardioides sp. LML1-1-1.1]|uniref:hypothetical protein n=1 Tax=Nocardioides sp. LML1-1-1.1 TaxID=3135248 RepID=UPI003444B183